MEIKINCKLLSEQIQLCDACAEKFKNNLLGEQFEGIANLLSEVCFAVEEGEEVKFKRVDNI